MYISRGLIQTSHAVHFSFFPFTWPYLSSLSLSTNQNAAIPQPRSNPLQSRRSYDSRDVVNQSESTSWFKLSSFVCFSASYTCSVCGKYISIWWMLINHHYTSSKIPFLRTPLASSLIGSWLRQYFSFLLFSHLSPRNPPASRRNQDPRDILDQSELSITSRYIGVCLFIMLGSTARCVRNISLFEEGYLC